MERCCDSCGYEENVSLFAEKKCSECGSSNVVIIEKSEDTKN